MLLIKDAQRNRLAPRLIQDHLVDASRECMIRLGREIVVARLSLVSMGYDMTAGGLRLHRMFHVCPWLDRSV